MKKILFYSLCLSLISCASKDELNKNSIKSHVVFDSGKNARNIEIQNQTIILTEKFKTPEKVVKKNVEVKVVSGILPFKERAKYQEKVDITTTNSPLNQFDAAAKQLAGLYIPEKFSDKKAYEDYSDFVHKEWLTLGNSSLFMVKKWAEEHIHPLTPQTPMVFYPFGGPDVAYVSKFYPNATDYVLVGLEPIGNFNEIVNKLENPASIDNLKRSFSTYLQKGYFITSEMATQLSRSDSVTGVLYLMLLQLSLLNYDILLVENLSIDAQGNEVARGKNMIDCVKITCKNNDDQILRRFYFVRVNLGNDNAYLKSLMAFIKKNSFSTFIKSASYALHDRTLSNLQKFILDNSQSVLQDDSGIPFHCFNNQRWNNYAFGVYTQPTLKIFNSYRQHDLSEFFSKSKIVGLPFKIGYGFNMERPNLLLAVSEKQKIIREMDYLKNKPIGECESCKEKTELEKDQTSQRTPDNELTDVLSNSSPQLSEVQLVSQE